MMRSSAKRAAYGGLFTAAALLFSYVETLLPLQLFIPIPGFKLGIANVCVMLAFYYLGTLDGFLITLAKCGLTALLFGTPVSFWFSLGGGLLAFCFLLIAKYLIKENISFIGISVACAALHNIGQVFVFSFIFKDLAVFWYLEWLLPLSLITGILTGALALSFKKTTEKRI